MHTYGGFVPNCFAGRRLRRACLIVPVALLALFAACDDETPVIPRDAAADRPIDRGGADVLPGDGPAADRGGAGGAGGGGGLAPDAGGGAGGNSDGGPADQAMSDGARADGSNLPDVPADVPAPIDLSPSETDACSSSCSASQLGSFCANDKAVATCRAEGGCFVASPAMACPGIKTCGGAAGAAACLCPAAGANLGAGCATEGTRVCGNNAVLACTGDPAGSGCLVWAKIEDCAGGSACVVTGGVAACGGCGAPTTEISVDPVAGNDAPAGGTTPTGAANPPACRFKSLARALAAAAPGKLRVVVRGATKPVRFDGEALPVVVPAGVRLSSEDPGLDPAQVRLVVRGPLEAAVALGDGATIEGF
ncbi:MAG TPA: hypothetical protein VGF45_17995, partial [Polyangia bacterium]